MSQPPQDERGDFAVHQQPPERYPQECPHYGRLLAHIIVTVLLLALVVATATWLLLVTD
jgi:hypothetical protein